MKIAILVIVLFTSGWGSHTSHNEFESMSKCLETLKEVKIVIPNGAENEGGAIAYCKMK